MEETPNFVEIQIFSFTIKESGVQKVWNIERKCYENKKIRDSYITDGYPAKWASAWGYNQRFTYVQFKDLVQFVIKDEVWYGIALRTLTDEEIKEIEQCTKATLMTDIEKNLLPDEVTEYFITITKK